jgi:hypothetical protein
MSSPTIRITIELGNAAFDGDGRGAEVARILEALAQRYRASGVTKLSFLYDINGNPVGEAQLLPAREPARRRP